MFSTRDLGASIVLRVVVYYAALVGLTWFLIRLAAPSGGMPEPLRELLGFAPVTLGDFSRGEILSRPPNVAGVRVQILTASVAMISAFMLALPVAWVYILTRAKRGFQQSVVQSLIILPIVVAGILVLVKHSLALAFGLGAVVAAVRFRSNLEDSKDAVYVFLSIGLGLAAGVQVPVALALSVIFNSVILLLWYTDFGRAPADLEGDVARRRLERAMATANRTGMFVARLDEEVLESLSPDQLDALADRAWRRKRRHAPHAGVQHRRNSRRVGAIRPLAPRTYEEPGRGAHCRRWSNERILPALALRRSRSRNRWNALARVRCWPAREASPPAGSL
jgi:hypothetical protein